MRCPRCKGENTEDALVCSKCQLKLKSACPRCKTLNKIGQSVCSECNLMLIRFCPECKSANFPNAVNCRKCDFQLLKPQKKPVERIEPQQELHNKTAETIPPSIEKIEIEQINKTAEQENLSDSTEATLQEREPEQPHHVPDIQVQQENSYTEIQQEKTKSDDNKSKESNIKKLSRIEAHELLNNLIKTSPQGLIIDISAPDGTGKSTLLSSVTQTLKDQKIIWLIGICQPTNQLLPYAFFQDLFKTFLGLPLFVSNLNESKANLKKILETSLDIKNAQIQNILERILFNDFSGCSQSISDNQEEIHSAILQLMNILGEKGDIAVIIEDFEYIDNASLECIKILLNKGLLNRKNFLLINHHPDVNLRDVFPMENLKKKILSISLTSMAFDELNLSLLGMLNNQDILPEKIKTQIFALSKDTPLYMEQALWYLFQIGALISSETSLTFNTQAANIEIPRSLDELISTRLKIISKNSPDALKLIMAASLFGTKFIPALVQITAQMEEQQFNQLIQMLINNGIFTVVDQNSARFKHGWLWKIIYENSFTDEDIISYGAKLLEVYGKYTANISSAILARHAEEANLKDETYLYNNKAAKESAYLGCPMIFTDYQNKILELLPASELSDEEKELRKEEIEEQIGRANYVYNPKIAVEYLSNSILKAEKDNNLVKIIDLTGYLAKSCELAGNFFGVIECCDKALSLIDKTKYKLETILLNYYKLDSIFNLGRFEETIVHATNEVLPSLNNFIAKNKTLKGISIPDLINIEFEAEITLAKAYMYQGNKQGLDLAEHIVLKAQKANLAEHEIQARLLQALFYTIQGNIKNCNAILAAIKEKFSDEQTPDKFKLYWYFIIILSNLSNGDFEQAREFCIPAIIMANYFKEYNILSLLKLASGLCFEESGKIKEAYAIYDETVNYCSENKMATGALFSWYLAANSELENGDPEKAYEIADRSIEISQKPNISNYLAEIVLNKLLAKIRTKKGDFEGAQINIELAIAIAEKNDLMLFLVDLYLTFGRIYKEKALVKVDQSANSANVANRLFSKALSFAEQIENHYFISIADKELSELLTFCRKSNIKLENVC